VSSTVLELTDATFDEEIAASPVPVLVEFWAQWCPPCRVIAPILDSIAADYADRLRVCKVNSDERAELARPQLGAGRLQDGVRAVVAVVAVVRTGELRHLGEREPELLGPGDELQPPQIGRGVLAVARRGAWGLAQEPAPLVVPDRLDVHARLVRQLTDRERLHESEAMPRTGVRSQAALRTCYGPPPRHRARGPGS
jgi:thiol-disulfide isomerase/thioredoxin